MKALTLRELAGPAALQYAEVPIPVDDAKVLIAVRAVGISYPDLLMTYGRYQLRVPAPFVPGAEVSGVVVSTPEGSAVSPGDEVVAICLQLGGYAEFVAVDPMAVAPKPAEPDFGQAAALLTNFQTVHFAMTRRAGVRPGQTVLVLGAAGGIGTAAIQVAKALGAKVIAVVRRCVPDDELRALGADHVVRLAEGWAARVRGVTDGVGVDYVLDPIGGPAFDDAIRTLASEGQLLVVGFAGGEIPSVKVNRLLLRNASVTGVAWGEYVRAHPWAFAESMADLTTLVQNGLRPHVGARYRLEDAAAALTALEHGTIVGKAVLEPTVNPPGNNHR
jgi:NADPH2:quinone reductase